MKSSNLAAAILKVLGVYWLFSAASLFLALSTLLPLAREQAQYVMVRSVELGMQGLLYLVAGLLLIRKTDRLLKVLGLSSEASEEELEQAFAASLGFAIVGLYLSTNAITQVVELAASFPKEAQYMGLLAPRYRLGDFLRRHYFALIAYSIQLLVGIGCFLGRQALSSLWNRARLLRSGDKGQGGPSENGEDVPDQKR